MRARDILPLPETTAVQPQKPLTPAQARKRANKQERVQQQLRDEGTRHAAKVRDLTNRLPN